MPKISTIHKLPLDIKIEVKRRLRSQQFSQMDITSWLNGLGYDTTKSAVNRYAMNLKVDDKTIGVDREIMAVKGADIVALFEELAGLKARETEILMQIRMSMVPNTLGS
ncbi:MAG: DUF3486 family protein [Proteobacteria bacterium]|nr:DUF3486 family protein [Pseudomonadota bacterium]